MSPRSAAPRQAPLSASGVRDARYAEDPRQEPTVCVTLLPMTQGEAQEVDPLVGTTVAGKFTIIKMLGEGGMGCVYLAEQKLGNSVRKVALKTLHKHLSHDL